MLDRVHAERPFGRKSLSSWLRIPKQGRDGWQGAGGRGRHCSGNTVAFTGRDPLAWSRALLLSSCVTGRGNSVGIGEHFLLFLALQDTWGSSYVFPAPVLGSVISPRSL